MVFCILQINKLISCLPKLSFLNLSYNALGSVNVNAPESSYPSLKRLVLNRVGIQWGDLVPYLILIPKYKVITVEFKLTNCNLQFHFLFNNSLEELHLSFNQIEISVEQEDNGKTIREVFPKITTLHFDGNRVENRDHLLWLSLKFPSLTSLVLCDCPLWTLRWNSPAARKAQVSTK